MTKIYEVYICRYEDEVLYIGQGGRGRHKHCNSGTSHVYELNKIHFSVDKNKLETLVVKEFYDKEKALELEKELILRYTPSFNIVMMPNSKSMQKMKSGKETKKLLKDYIKNYSSLSEKSINKYFKLVDELLKYHGSNSIETGSLVIYSKQHYKELKLNLLSNFATHVRHPRKNTNRDLSPHSVLESCITEFFGIDLTKRVISKIPMKVVKPIVEKKP